MLTPTNNPEENCRFCGNKGTLLYESPTQVFYKCSICSGIFLAKHLLPDNEFEFSRYKLHNNDVQDSGYQQFVSPIVSAIIQDIAADHTLLDFGAGARSVIAKLLLEKGYYMDEYDPFFQNNTALLEKKYEHIACCETIEHFHEPEKEFQLLKRLLNSKGKLYLMTDPFHEGIDFSNWYYKNDPTHVFFYSKETFKWIKEKYGFSALTISGRLIALTSG